MRLTVDTILRLVVGGPRNRGDPGTPGEPDPGPFGSAGSRPR